MKRRYHPEPLGAENYCDDQFRIAQHLHPIWEVAQLAPVKLEKRNIIREQISQLRLEWQQLAGHESRINCYGRHTRISCNGKAVTIDLKTGAMWRTSLKHGPVKIGRLPMNGQELMEALKH